MSLSGWGSGSMFGGQSTTLDRFFADTPLHDRREEKSKPDHSDVVSGSGESEAPVLLTAPEISRLFAIVVASEKRAIVLV
jgi:hypothetical protein